MFFQTDNLAIKSYLTVFSMGLTLKYVTYNVGTSRTLKLLTCCDTLGFSLADYPSALHATNTN